MVTGEGYTDKLLGDPQVRELCRKGFEEREWDGKRVLFVIPDHSRTAPIDVMFRTGEKPIRAGSSLVFRLVTTNEQGGLSITFRDENSAIGSGKTL